MSTDQEPMEASNSFLFERHNLVIHFAEVELARQLLQRGSFCRNGCDVAAFQQRQSISDGFAVSVLEIFHDLINYEVVDLAQFFELVTHKKAGLYTAA